MNNQQKENFIRLRAIEGKSISTISQDLGLSPEEIKDWDQQLGIELLNAKAAAYDKILEKNLLNNINRFQHLVEIYNKLKTEIDKRDFSGLPTDKLYYIMNDVYELIQFLKNDESNYSVE